MLCFALLTLTACSENLFGSPSNGNCGYDVKCLQQNAENAFRNHNYGEAYKIYNLIVNIDSTVSTGYFGMAKAGLWMNGVNPFDVFGHIKKEGGEIAFMDQSPKEQNRYFQGMKKAGPALRELERRDSLTVLYEFHIRSLAGFDTAFTVIVERDDGIKDTIRNVSVKSRLEDYGKPKPFRQEYCDMSTGVCAGFPLSDRIFRYNTYSGGLLISSIAEKILNTVDTNKDGCIAKRCPEKAEDRVYGDCSNYRPSEPKQLQGWANWGCEKNSNGNYSYDLSINLALNEEGNFEINFNQILDEIDLEDFYNDLESNPNTELPDEILSLNEKMDDFNGDMNEIIEIMNSFKVNQGSEEVPFGWETDIGAYKDYSTFYKIGTNIDEDGDGCIGEDILDGRDNDGDGLKNGNARLVPVDAAAWANPNRFRLDGVDNSMAGRPEWNLPKKYHKNDANFRPICRDKARTDCIREELADEEDSITVIRFTQEMQMPDYWTTNDLEKKLAVARDTVCPPKYSLQDRIDMIGGCWPNYDENKFVTSWLKRGYAREADKNARIHSSCKDNRCTGLACLGK